MSLLHPNSSCLLGVGLNIQIMATFNTSLKNLDPALMRKGRLKLRYEFKKLKEERSVSLSNKLKLNCSVNQPMTLAEIYNNENGSNETKKSNIGFN